MQQSQSNFISYFKCTLRVMATAILLQSTLSAAQAEIDDPVSKGEFRLSDVPANILNEAITIEALGDSLTAGYGLKQYEALPNQLQELINQRGFSKVFIRNSGVSGDTSADGLERAVWVLSPSIDGVILALGGNDLLRSLKPIDLYSNLAKIINYAKSLDIVVLLAGMKGGYNNGQAYAEAFEGVYPALAREKQIQLYPFLLQGVALNKSLNLADGLHPNAKGVSIMARNMLPFVEEMILRIYYNRTVKYQKEQKRAKAEQDAEQIRIQKERAETLKQIKDEREKREREIAEAIAKNPATIRAKKLEDMITNAKSFDVVRSPLKYASGE